MFNDLIREAITEHQDDDSAARQVLERLSREQLEEELLPLVRDECRRRRRAGVRQKERQAANGSGNPRPGSSDAADPASERAAWLASVFVLPDGRRVAWGEATIEDHVARMDYLNDFRREVQETIDLHERVRQAIEAAGVTCLDEVPNIEELEL